MDICYGQNKFSMFDSKLPTKYFRGCGSPRLFGAVDYMHCPNYRIIVGTCGLQMQKNHHGLTFHALAIHKPVFYIFLHLHFLRGPKTSYQEARDRLLLQLLSQYDICIYINFQGNRTINTVPVANTSLIYFIAFTKKIISICVKCHATPHHQPYSLAEFKRHRWSRWRRNPKNVLPVSVCSPSQFVPRLSSLKIPRPDTNTWNIWPACSQV